MIEEDGVPVLFVHMEARDDRTVVCTPFKGFLGVAFKVNTFKRFEGCDGKYFVIDFKDHVFGAEGEAELASLFLLAKGLEVM